MRCKYLKITLFFHIFIKIYIKKRQILRHTQSYAFFYFIYPSQNSNIGLLKN